MKKFKKKLKALKSLFTLELAVRALPIVLVAAGTGMLLYGATQLYSSQKTTKNPLGRSSVMIVRSDKRSGGSGTIIASSASESIILTNAHVCGVVDNGGTVITDDGSEHRVIMIRRSVLHDLCLIRVAANLGVNTRIAKSSPELYSSATIIGHPLLNPTTVTEGVFSKRNIIEVMTGVRPCTEEESKDQGTILICALLGGFPQVTTFEAQFVTAGISPGSSGSPVFNSKGELAGVVFAGSGENAPGYIVPLESVLNFLSPYLEDGFSFDGVTLPENTQEINMSLTRGRTFDTSDFTKRFANLCADTRAISQPNVQYLCEQQTQDMLWRN